MLPGAWLAEGERSATGTLIDHIVYAHACWPELQARERSQETTACEILNTRLSLVGIKEPGFFGVMAPVLGVETGHLRMVQA
jgi:ribulose kinase